VFLGAGFYRQFTNLFIMYPTRAQVEQLAALYPTGPADIAGLYDPGDPDVYILLDARRRNLGRQKVSGLDFSLNYVRPTGFGSVDLTFAGTYELTRNTQAFTGAPFVDSLLRDISRFRSATTVGANISNLRAQVTWNHNAGYDLTRQAGFNFQTKVGSFDVFNLFMRYDVKGEDLFKDLAFTLNVNNVFDTDPPLLQGFSLSSSGFTNGNTLGRVFQFGVSKKF
jgi:iron complex outermembrane receptor protein